MWLLGRPRLNALPARCLQIATLVATCSTAELAQADDAAGPRVDGTSATAMALVQVRVVGTADALSALKQALVGIRRHEAELKWSQVSSFAPQQILSLYARDRLIVYCWIDLSDAEQAHLYFVAPRHDRFMIRDFDLEHRFGTLEIESLAQIVETSIEVLLTDDAAGMSRREIEAALGAPPPPPPVATTPPASLEARRPIVSVPPKTAYSGLVEIAYAFETYSRELPLLHGPSLSLGIERRRLDSWQWAKLTATYALPTRVRGNVVSADIERAQVALTLSPLWAIQRSPRQGLGPRVTIGTGYQGATSLSGNLDGAYELSTPPRRFEPYLGVGAQLMTSLGEHGAIVLFLDANAILRPVRYVIEVNGGEESLTEGRRVRLEAGLGLQLH